MQTIYRHQRFTTDIRGLMRLAGPLMLVALSMNLMLFLDRVILARYSLDVMNAVATVGITCSILQYGGVAIASIAEVMVGHFNGAGHYRKVGPAIWQMIWFSVALFALSIPLAIWGGDYLVPVEQQALGLPYYRLMMFFAPLGGIFAALAAFFIGLGQAHLVTRTVIFSSVLNLGFACLLVFGIEGYMPPLGGVGAAIATVVAQLSQVLILLWFFLRPANRRKYASSDLSLKMQILKASLRIGIPSSAGHMIEISAWAFLYQAVASKGSDYLTVFAIGETLFIIFAFINDGLYKAVVAIVSNFLGEKRYHDINPLIASSVKVYGLSLLVVCIPFLLMPELSLRFMLGDKDFALLGPALQTQIYKTLLLVWLYAFVDSMVSTLAGVLTAAGDTAFYMVVNACNAWFFGVLPTYLLLQSAFSPSLIWCLYVIYGVMNLVFLTYRYRQGRWREKPPIILPMPVPLRSASA